jgi:hypothetical protein
MEASRGLVGRDLEEPLLRTVEAWRVRIVQTPATNALKNQVEVWRWNYVMDDQVVVWRTSSRTAA